ncbi:MAG: DUF2341 domain-containing protein, partial [Kiritimatiellae bacterium]|nr:DUF2341 domain-containing protein [Kiritimatiellia bacterium]
DFAAAAGTLTFAAGVTNESVIVTILDDAVDEGDETVLLSLGNVSGAELGAVPTHTLTIADDDTAAVRFDLAQSEAVENGGVTVIGVNLTQASSGAVTVDYALGSGTAEAGVDFAAAAGTLTFAAGVTNRTIALTILDDAVDEPDETVALSLANPANAPLGAPSIHTCTILDDDTAAAQFARADSVLPENPGTVLVAILLSPASASTVTVSYAVTGGTARAGEDYAPVGGTLTFEPGVTNLAVQLFALDDDVAEGPETVELALTHVSGAGQGTVWVHVCTIEDDDACAVEFGAATSGGTEGETVPVPVRLTTPCAQTVTVSYAVAGGTADSASDYALGDGTLTFPPGMTNLTVGVALTDDTVNEESETIVIALADPVHAVLGAVSVHTCTIADDDAPRVLFAEEEIWGGEPVSSVAIPVRLSAPAVVPVTVDYAVSGGTADAAVDFIGGQGTLTFDPGATNLAVSLAIVNDAIDEDDELIVLALGNPVNAALGRATTICVIEDDDTATVSFAATGSVVAENGGAAAVSVCLSTPADRTVTVQHAVTGGTAAKWDDYSAGAGTLTFEPGVTNASFSLAIVDDTLDESDETVVLGLSDVSGVALGAVLAHTVTIADDDETAVRFAADASIGDEGSVLALPVTLSLVSAQTVTVDYAVSGGTASHGTDFVAPAGTLTFAPGTTNLAVAVVILDDTQEEEAESLVLTLRAPVGARLGAVSAHTVTIAPNDTRVVQFERAESAGSEAVSPAAVSVCLNLPAERDVMVHYAVAGGTAGSDSDFVLSSGTLTFAPGASNRVVMVTVLDDTKPEPDETIALALTGAAHAVLGTLTNHTYTILDDDVRLVQFDATASAVAEDGPVLAIPVSLSAPASDAVTVEYAVTGGTAADGVDFLLSAGTLTFRTGEATCAIVLTPCDDSEEEGGETVVLALSDAGNASLGICAVHTCTLIDRPCWVWGYAYRRAITIDGSQVSGARALLDFPLLVRAVKSELRGIAYGGRVTREAGHDIVFAGGDGITRLDHEIELYDPATGALAAWVRVPVLSAGADTVLYLYYGNPAETGPQQNANGVWGVDYAAVWHLAEDPAGAAPQFRDATAHANHGTAQGSAGLASFDSPLGKAVQFPGTNGWIDVPSAGVVNSLDVTGTQLTLEAWARVPAGGVDEDEALFVKASGGNQEKYMLGVEYDTTGTYPNDRAHVRLNYHKTSAADRIRLDVANAFPRDQWVHEAAVYDGAQVRLYVNGQLAHSAAYALPIDSVSADSVAIGRRIGTERFFEGAIDELRVSTAARSADWIKTTHANLSAPADFASCGAEERGCNAPEPVVAAGAVWRYRKGTAEASDPVTAWREPAFDASGWASGAAPFGYGDGPYDTTLTDMRDGYASVFLRREFVVPEPAMVCRMDVWALYDDGFIVWINGEEVARVAVAGVPGSFVPHDGLAVAQIEPAVWRATFQTDALPEWRAGTNVVAVQVFNGSLRSSDLTFDCELALLTRTAFPGDGDFDGIPDEWEQDFLAGTDRSAAEDTDGDGLSNLHEFICGTDPGSGVDCFAVDIALSNGFVHVSLPCRKAEGAGYAGLTRHYTLEASAGAADGPWEPVPGYTNVLATNQVLHYTEPADGGRVFFRARVWLEQE